MSIERGCVFFHLRATIRDFDGTELLENFTRKVFFQAERVWVREELAGHTHNPPAPCTYVVTFFSSPTLSPPLSLFLPFLTSIVGPKVFELCVLVVNSQTESVPRSHFFPTGAAAAALASTQLLNAGYTLTKRERERCKNVAGGSLTYKGMQVRVS